MLFRLFFLFAPIAAMLTENENQFTGECLKANSLTAVDLKTYKTIDEIPENVLCYRKCIITKLGSINKTGKVDPNKLLLVAGIENFDESKMNRVLNCIEEIKEIVECADMRKLQNCFLK